MYLAAVCFIAKDIHSTAKLWDPPTQSEPTIGISLCLEHAVHVGSNVTGSRVLYCCLRCAESNKHRCGLATSDEA